MPEGQPKIDLRAIDLSTVADSLADYNDKFHIGSVIARQLIDLLPIEGREPRESPAQSEEEQRALTLEELHTRYGPQLRATGLSLEPIEGGATLLSQAGATPSSEMRINLANGESFLNYLGVLEATSLTDGQAKGLQSVAESLTQQLVQRYNLSSTNDERALELFGSLGKIIEHYHRLDPESQKGLQKAVQDLESYLEYARAGYLREHLLVHNNQLMDEIGGQNFGPSKWHTDATPERYKELWGQAVKIADQVGTNPRAQQLYQRLVEHLKASLRYAKEQLIQSPPDYLKERVDEYMVIIDEAYEALA